jgi:hypothetical protein
MKRTELLLVQLAEEAAEVANAASKCIRFLPDRVHLGNLPGQEETNAMRVVREMTDLGVIAMMLQEMGVLPIQTPQQMQVLVNEKRAKVEKLLDLSFDLGVLQK